MTPADEPANVADRYDERALSAVIATRLAGTPADGGPATAGRPTKVLWVDLGDEVLVHLDSLRTRIVDRVVLVSVDLETDQTGRTPLVVALALGNADDPAGLVAVTDEFPRGHGVLAARWGVTLQNAVWASVLGLARDHASERRSAPLGISASPGVLAFRAGPALSARPLESREIS